MINTESNKIKKIRGNYADKRLKYVGQLLVMLVFGINRTIYHFYHLLDIGLPLMLKERLTHTLGWSIVSLGR